MRWQARGRTASSRCCSVERVFDLARAVAVVWAVARTLRARAWGDAAVLAIAAYVFALAVWSGFVGSPDPRLAFSLAIELGLVGPSALPRGPLPAVPLAAVVMGWPATLDLISAAAVLGVSQRRLALVQHLSPFSRESDQLRRAAVSAVLVGVLTTIAGLLRVLLWVAEREV
jgi:hypothetical protein